MARPGGGGGAKTVRNILGARARVTKRVGSKGSKGLFAADSGAGKENTASDAAMGEVGSADGQEEEEGVEEKAAPIRREDDFQGWLAQQKAGWQRHREQSRLKRRTEARSEVGVFY